MKVRNVLVIGGAGFIGSAIARGLVLKGFTVFSTSKSGKLGYIPLDVTKRGSINDLKVWLGEQKIVLHAVIYAVGDCPPKGFMKEVKTPLMMLGAATLKKNMAMHVEGFLQAVQGLAPMLNDGGHIVVIGSAITRLNDAPADKVPSFLCAGQYAAAKSAQRALIGWFRKDVGILAKDIHIHCLAPGAVDSPFHEGTPLQCQSPNILQVDAIVAATAQALGMKEGYLDTDFSTPS